MDIKTLKYFQKVYECRSLHTASKALYISPQGLGKIIHRLEEEVGSTLFLRSPSGLVPTESGEILYRRSREITGQLERMMEEIEYVGTVSKRLRLGFATGVLRVISVTLIANFIKAHKELSGDWIESGNDTVINQVAAGKLDYGFVIGKPENPELETKLLFHQPLAIYVPKGHPLEYKEAVTFSDLQGEPFLTMNEHYHIFDMVQEGCRAAGFEPDIRARVVEGQTLITLVEAGQGVAFLPQFLEGLPESVCAVSFDPDVTWDIWGIQRADSEDQELFEKLERYIVRHLSVR